MTLERKEYKKKIRNSYRTGQRDKRRNKRLVILMLSILGFSLCALFSLSIRLEVRRLDYWIGERESDKLEIRSKTEALMGDVSSRQSLDRIENAALNQLGMASPETGRTVYVRVSDGTAEQPGDLSTGEGR